MVYFNKWAWALAIIPFISIGFRIGGWNEVSFYIGALISSVIWGFVLSYCYLGYVRAKQRALNLYNTQTGEPAG